MELKPRPFGGNEANLVEKDGLPGWSYWRVVCGCCLNGTEEYPLKSAAIKAWNRRDGPLIPPLTLDELRGMDGEPVWCDLSLCKPVPHVSQWAIVRENESEVLLANGGFLPFVFYGRTWLAYRRMPEEVSHETQ